jgi:tetratricopeptide (TPR) repeat protein
MLAALAVLLGGCATAPVRPEAPAPPPRVAQATPTPPGRVHAPAAEPTEARPSRLLEESNVGEVPELTPAPAALAAAPTPAPEQVAALPSPGLEAAEQAATSAEPDSLLTRIGPTTPPNVVAALRLIEDGRQHVRDGRYDQAIERFERAVAIDPTNAYGYFFLAQLHYLTKKFDQAIAFANRAAVLSARTDRIWLGRVYSLQAAVFEDVGRYPDARKAYQKAVEADPNNLGARVGIARLTPTE